MTNVIDTAKSLLQKGIALNDPELIRMANELLGGDTKIDVVAPTIPVLVCDNCKHEFSSEKPKKSCPKCKKRKLSIKQEKEEPKKVNTGIHQGGSIYSGQANSKQIRYNKDTGQEEGSYGRTEPIKVAANQFVDDGEEGQDGRMFDEKYGKFFKVQKRHKAPAAQLTVKCYKCSKDFSLSPLLYRRDGVYTCTKCIMNGAR